MNMPLSLPPEHAIDTQMLELARNIAMGLYELDELLGMLGIDRRAFERWKTHPRFLSYLRSETQAWQKAGNTVERAQLKAAAIVENWLLEANAQLHNKTSPLNHKVELAKTVMKIAGIGESNIIGAGKGGSGGFSLTINIGPGADERVTLTPKVTIDHEPDED